MTAATPEQQKIIDAFQTGEDLVIMAGAGTGKTTTLRMLGESLAIRDAEGKITGYARKGAYIAYNRDIAADAKASFPSNVRCGTAHSFAFGVGRLYAHRIVRMGGPRVTLRQQAQVMGIVSRFSITPETSLTPAQQMRIVNDTVRNFCNSADDEIHGGHVHRIDGAEENMGKIRTLIVPLAQRAWADIVRKDGRLPVNDDHYLKIWALGRPALKVDFVLFDEAQDANPVIAKVVEDQACQKIMVGDSSQAIYGWRGAVDAMDKFDPSAPRLVLSQSFRFGQAVADEANKWLDLLDAPLRLKGFEKIQSSVVSGELSGDPDAVLCRTNAECVARAVNYLAAGRVVALLVDTTQLKAMAEAARDLLDGKQPWNPEFAAFKTWADFVEYVEDENDGSLKVFVRLVEDYGPETIIQVMESVLPAKRQDQADIVISTAHKAKGREWDHVLIADDFREPNKEEGEVPSRSEMMLAYVAVTRAKVTLDNSGLAWVNGWIGAGR